MMAEGREFNRNEAAILPAVIGMTRLPYSLGRGPHPEVRLSDCSSAVQLVTPSRQTLL